MIFYWREVFFSPILRDSKINFFKNAQILNPPNWSLVSIYISQILREANLSKRHWGEFINPLLTPVSRYPTSLLYRVFFVSRKRRRRKLLQIMRLYIMIVFSSKKRRRRNLSAKGARKTNHDLQTYLLWKPAGRDRFFFTPDLFLHLIFCLPTFIFNIFFTLFS